MRAAALPGQFTLENLVRDLLAHTRVTMLDPPLANADANAALQTLLANLAGVICETHARIVAEALPAPIPVHSTHLEQLLETPLQTLYVV